MMIEAWTVVMLPDAQAWRRHRSLFLLRLNFNNRCVCMVPTSLVIEWLGAELQQVTDPADVVQAVRHLEITTGGFKHMGHGLSAPVNLLHDPHTELVVCNHDANLQAGRACRAGCPTRA